MKILIATEKPFAKIAIDGIRKIVESLGHELHLLEKYTDVSQLLSAVTDADALIVRSDKVTKQVIEVAEKLKIVVRAGAGFDNLDLAACTEKNIVAMNTPGQNSNAVAELVSGLMVFMNRNKFNAGTGSELKGKRLGIHAYGNVGRMVARIAKGFEMQIWAFDPFVQKETMQADGITAVDMVEDLYSNCDYVSLHIPANDKTKKSINYKLLNLMPQGGCLINTARREVIDEDDLLKLLADRTDMKYATDVAPSNISELQQKFASRIFATPQKLGAETAEANINAGLAAAHQIVNYFKYGDTTFQVNK
ncbi:MAG: 3-phosphoglycerate dehydrogenase [Prevotellaceae bacterium]|jgi:D-3-phosphoglycerate dehydrogenase|nr:3-phosphoglycerate dehydrogenase [Prevotellaceae bacterium]